MKGCRQTTYHLTIHTSYAHEIKLHTHTHTHTHTEREREREREREDIVICNEIERSVALHHLTKSNISLWMQYSTIPHQAVDHILRLSQCTSAIHIQHHLTQLYF